MDSGTLSIIVVSGILLLTFITGINIGAGLGLAGVIGSAVFTGNWKTGLWLPLIQTLDIGMAYMLMVIPLFILMGTLSGASQITKDLFEVFYRWFGRLPGGIALTTIGTCGTMSAISGSSMAVSAAMSKIAMPELMRYKYDRRMSIGSIAMGGTVAIMIPPSITLVLYAIFAEQSVGRMLLAGLFPGLLIIFLYCCLVFMRCRLNPELGPPGPRFSLRERLVCLPSVLPFIGVVMSVTLSILFGIATPVEAAAIAVVIVFGICIWRRTLTMEIFVDAVLDAVLISASVIFVVIGSLVFSNYLALTGYTTTITNIIANADLSPAVLMLVITVIYLIIGCVMETTSVLALTVPLAVPVAIGAGWDPVWFGVIIVCFMEIAAVTPPVGLNLFVVKASIPNTSLVDVYMGSFPFWIMTLVAVLILYLFPPIATWLPSQM